MEERRVSRSSRGQDFYQRHGQRATRKQRVRTLSILHVVVAGCGFPYTWFGVSGGNRVVRDNGNSIDLKESTRKWRNWQTHQLEGLAVAISWGFESPLPHSIRKGPGTPGPFSIWCVVGGSGASTFGASRLGLRARVPPSANQISNPKLQISHLGVDGLPARTQASCASMHSTLIM